jgi:hypothetical protein
MKINRAPLQPGFRAISADLRSSLAIAAAWAIACRHSGLTPRPPAPSAAGSCFAIARPASVGVFVISILAAWVNLDRLATIRPGPGAAAFAAVT